MFDQKNKKQKPLRVKLVKNTIGKHRKKVVRSQINLKPNSSPPIIRFM